MDYSSWIYSAIHIACANSGLGMQGALSQAFGLQPEAVGKVLDFLASHGFLIREGEEYQVSRAWIRLDRSSPHIFQLHAIWRIKAVQSLETQSADDLRYSGVYAVDVKTALQIKDRLMDFIHDQLKEIEPTPGERQMALGLGFVQVS